MVHTQQPITRLLEKSRLGDTCAANEVMHLIYAELHHLAQQVLKSERRSQSLNPTGLVHEAYMRLMGSEQPVWENRSHFFAMSAKVMRRVMVDRARKRRCEKRGPNYPHISLDEDLPITRQDEPDWLALDEVLTQLAKRFPRKVEVVELRIFAGMTIEETAAVLNISEATVSKDYSFAKGWLYRKLNCEPK